MKIALGMIARSLSTDEEVMRFIKNAEKHSHKIDLVIVGYSQHINPVAADNINRKVPLFAIDVRYPYICIEQFRRRGISAASAKTLLQCPVDISYGLVPYGYDRTIVTIEAILQGADILFFVDNDVFPAALKMTPGGLSVEEIDFFGAHLEHLEKGSSVTTGEYSGFNILPQASFDGMDDLLKGLQKSDVLEYWKNSAAHRCLVVKPPEHKPSPCTKILGGNVAITLSAFSGLPPFFSSSYIVDDELFLGRGEDTVLGFSIAERGIACTDIGLYPLHDTYKDYPSEPDLLGNPRTQERLYYACTGWVGRNPLYSYLRGDDVQSIREYQREHLERGLRALAEYTLNPRYYRVLKNFDVSWDSLGRYVDEYSRVIEAWEEFIQRSY